MTMLDTRRLGVVLKSRGVHMSRSKYQRPDVHLWTGKSGEKFWKAEWRVYIEGRPKAKHRAQTWPCALYTKAKAQEECDQIVREETGGALRPDGSMTVREFWDQIFFPTIKLRIALNTQTSYESNWRNYLKPAIGETEIQHVNKAMLDGVLNKMALAGKAQGTVKVVFSLAHAIFAEAVENGYITRNPAHRMIPPRAKDPQETRALTEEEAGRLLSIPAGRGTLIFRIMLLTGARIGEVLALEKPDLTSVGLRIDESALRGRASTTKNRKTRTAPLPPALRSELEQWAASQSGELLFPNREGKMDKRSSDAMRTIYGDVRAASKIPDLTPRMCRTTFATLFQGDPRDVQDILGHSTVNLTMEVYRRPIMARQQVAVDELEGRLTGKVISLEKGRKSA